MVFAYARDNLGTDFTIFLYMAIFASVCGLLAFLMTSYQYCFVLKKGDPIPTNENGFVDSGNIEMQNDLM
jgi:hypothetical protein